MGRWHILAIMLILSEVLTPEKAMARATAAGQAAVSVRRQPMDRCYLESIGNDVQLIDPRWDFRPEAVIRPIGSPGVEDPPVLTAPQLTEIRRSYQGPYQRILQIYAETVAHFALATSACNPGEVHDVVNRFTRVDNGPVSGNGCYLNERGLCSEAIQKLDRNIRTNQNAFLSDQNVMRASLNSAQVQISEQNVSALRSCDATQMPGLTTGTGHARMSQTCTDANARFERSNDQLKELTKRILESSDDQLHFRLCRSNKEKIVGIDGTAQGFFSPYVTVYRNLAQGMGQGAQEYFRAKSEAGICSRMLNTGISIDEANRELARLQGRVGGVAPAPAALGGGSAGIVQGGAAQQVDSTGANRIVADASSGNESAGVGAVDQLDQLRQQEAARLQANTQVGGGSDAASRVPVNAPIGNLDDSRVVPPLEQVTRAQVSTQPQKSWWESLLEAIRSLFGGRRGSTGSSAGGGTST